jgi:hypothetical protein
LFACSKSEDNGQPLAFETSIKNITATIPIIHYLRHQPEVAGTIFFNLDSTVKAHQSLTSTNKNASSVKVKSISLRLLNSDSSNNFSNIEYCFISFSIPNKTQAVIIAEKNISITSDSTVEMQGNGVELINYVKNGEVKVTVDGKARNSTSKELQLAMDFVLRIE